MAIDWKRNNKIALRNFSKNCDFHDIVKTLIVRLLRRKYSDANKYPIYTEFNSEDPHQSYPDIEMKIKNDIYVWELQDRITPSWLETIKKKYEDVNLIVVDLRKLIRDWYEAIRTVDGDCDVLERLRTLILEPQIGEDNIIP